MKTMISFLIVALTASTTFATTQTNMTLQQFSAALAQDFVVDNFEGDLSIGGDCIVSQQQTKDGLVVSLSQGDKNLIQLHIRPNDIVKVKDNEDNSTIRYTLPSGAFIEYVNAEDAFNSFQLNDLQSQLTCEVDF